MYVKEFKKGAEAIKEMGFMHSLTEWKHEHICHTLNIIFL